MHASEAPTPHPQWIDLKWSLQAGTGPVLRYTVVVSAITGELVGLIEDKQDHTVQHPFPVTSEKTRGLARVSMLTIRRLLLSPMKGLLFFASLPCDDIKLHAE